MPGALGLLEAAQRLRAQGRSPQLVRAHSTAWLLSTSREGLLVLRVRKCFASGLTPLWAGCHGEDIQAILGYPFHAPHQQLTSDLQLKPEVVDLTEAEEAQIERSTEDGQNVHWLEKLVQCFPVKMTCMDLATGLPWSKQPNSWIEGLE